RTDVEGLSLLSVPSTKLGSVPLLDVVRLGKAEGPSSIDRLSRQRQVTLMANVRPGVSEAGVAQKLDAAVKQLNLPSEYTAGPTGRSRELARTARYFGLAF